MPDRFPRPLCVALWLTAGPLCWVAIVAALAAYGADALRYAAWVAAVIKEAMV